MYILDNAIVDISQDAKLETKIIKCFKDDDDLIIFGSAEFTEKDIKYFDDMKDKLGIEMVYDIQSLNEPWGFKEPILTSFEMWYDWPNNGRKIKKVNWYRADTTEILEKILESEGVTYKCRIVEIDKEATNYKFELNMDENYFVNGNEDAELRSLVIETRDTISFSKKVLPKLINIIKNNI